MIVLVVTIAMAVCAICEENERENRENIIVSPTSFTLIHSVSNVSVKAAIAVSFVLIKTKVIDWLVSICVVIAISAISAIQTASIAV